MKHLLLLLLLLSSSALGLGLAAMIAVNSAPGNELADNLPVVELPELTSSAAFDGAAPAIAVPDAALAPSLDGNATAATEAPRFAPSRDGNALPAIRTEMRLVPLEEEPLPPRAQQAEERAESKDSADMLLRALDKLKQLQETAAVAPAVPGTPPTPPDSANATVPEGELPPPTPTERVPRKRISRSPNAGEGDDSLSIHIQDTDLREVLEMISEQGQLNILASSSVEGKVSASLNDVSIDTALEAILRSTGYVARREGRFIYVGTSEDFANLQTALDKVGTRVYRPNYVTAADLQMLLTPMLTPTTGKISVTAPASIGIAANGNEVGGDSFANAEAVLVQDYEAVLAQIDQVVREIDKRPLQVAIEAMILSVRLDDNHQMGVDFQFLRDQQNVRMGTGSPRTDPLNGSGAIDGETGGTIGAFDFTSGGLKFAFLDDNLGVFINALESIGDTNVIATPRLMCMNKQRAEVLIGAQLGYISTTLTETATTQNVEFLEVGTQLRIRPFISSDGMVRMEIHPELSTGAVRIEGGFTLPDKEVTQVTTNIMARDGSTVIIGGLMREDLANTTTQVPLLGSLPLVGPLFRNKNESMERREILVLVTPRIVYDEQSDAEGKHGAENFHHRQDVYRDHMSPIAKRYLGRTALRKAKGAWGVGDRDAALKYADRAIFFDVTSMEAIKFRDQVLAGIPPDAMLDGPIMDETAPTEILEPGEALANPLEGEVIAPWLLNDLRQPGDEPLHPIDPGQAGSRIEIERPDLLRGDINADRE